jgi:Tol biopolymer transport system component
MLAGGPLAAGEVTLLSRADPAKAPDAPSGAANLLALSADGRWVAFEDAAPNLVAGQSGPATFNIFLHDRVSGTTLLASRAAGSTTQGGNDASGYPSISDDGRYVYFASQATDLVAGQVDTPNTFDVFVFDRVSGTTALVSHASGSPTTAVGGSHLPNFETRTAALSADGRYAAYTSAATNLVAGQVDTNASRDVFLYDRATGTSRLVSHVPGSATTAGNDDATQPYLSADGRWVVFESTATDLVAGQGGGVFLFDRDNSGTLSFVAPGSDPKISADGGWIVFASASTNLVPGQVDDNGAGRDVFLAEGAITLVSHTSASPTETGNAASAPASIDTDEPVLSSDGRYVAFVSEATDLVAGQLDTNGSFGRFDVFLFDRVAGTVVLVSGAASAPATQTGNSQSLGPTISSDGRYVAFFSEASNLVAGQVDTNSFGFAQDVFLYDRTTGTKTLASHASGAAATTGNGGSYLNRLSADGAWIASISRATNLEAGIVDDNGTTDIYLFGSAAGTNALASRRGGTPETAAGGSIALQPSSALSHDGRWVAFVSSAYDVDSGAEDTLNTSDVFLFDRLSRKISLVSRDAATGKAAGGFDPLLSADGGAVVFLSAAPGLVPGQVNAPGGFHVFLHDRAAGAATLVSHAAGAPSTTANQGSSTSRTSASRDGRWIAFTSPPPTWWPARWRATRHRTTSSSTTAPPGRTCW